MTAQLMRERTRRQARPKTPSDYRPTEDEPFMNTRQRAYFRAKLLASRDEIVLSMKETRQHLHQQTVQHTLFGERPGQLVKLRSGRGNTCTKKLCNTRIFRIERAQRPNAG